MLRRGGILDKRVTKSGALEIIQKYYDREHTFTYLLPVDGDGTESIREAHPRQVDHWASQDKLALHLGFFSFSLFLSGSGVIMCVS